jgi:hypothetical protein
MSDVFQHDHEVLKPLIDRYLEMANHPRQEARKRLWADHYAMRPALSTPFSVYFEGMSGTAWRDVLGGAPLQAHGKVARSIEDQLRKHLWMEAHVDDDTPKWRSVILGCPAATDTGWGVPITYREPGVPDGAHVPVPPFADGADLARLRRPELIPDVAQGERIRDEAAALLDGRLAVHLRYPALASNAFDVVVDLRGMDRVFLDVFDRPDDVHALMDFVTEAVVAHARMREREGWLNVFYEDGGAYVRGLHRIRAFEPLSGPPTIADEWPYISAQTSAGLGPDQFAAFIEPYHDRLARLCNRPTVYYHGCECLDQKMFVIMRMPNLKHFHVSPYTNLDHAIRHLRSDLIIEAHSHPGNVFFAFTDAEVEADVRERLRRVAVRQAGLFLSDIHSVNGRPDRLAHWAACCRRYAGR